MRSFPADRSASAILLLLATAPALVAAFLFAPAALLRGAFGEFGDDAVLRDAVGRGLVEYWRGGEPGFPALLARLVDYWFRWHAVKVVVSSLMVLVFALLAVALWRRYLHGRAWHAVGATGATVFAVLATGLLVLNIQATAVPLMALLPLAPGGELGREIRAGLTEQAGPNAGSPVLTALLGEAERYHWVMAAMAATVIVAAVLAGVSLWRRRGAGDARARLMRRTLGVVTVLTTTLFLLVVAASVLSAAQPANTLLTVLG